MEQIYKLLHQIIEYNIYKDLLNKKPEETGDSWNVHHLKLLKDLIEQYEQKNKE